MADATGTRASPPATPWLPRRQTSQIRHRATLFVLRTHAGGDACVPVASAIRYAWSHPPSTPVELRKQMQSDARERDVNPIPAKIREMLERVCFAYECPDQSRLEINSNPDPTYCKSLMRESALIRSIRRARDGSDPRTECRYAVIA
jgi:hypothetical protein